MAVHMATTYDISPNGNTIHFREFVTHKWRRKGNCGPQFTNRIPQLAINYKKIPNAVQSLACFSPFWIRVEVKVSVRLMMALVSTIALQRASGLWHGFGQPISCHN